MTEPYYEDDLVTLYHGDCREITTWLEADALVTDPPYGIGYRSHRRPGWGSYDPTDHYEDHSTDARDTMLALWGPDRPALLFGTWKRPRPTGTRQVVIWDKTTSNGLGSDIWSPWGQTHEEIYVLGTWGGRTGPSVVVDGKKREQGVIRIPNYNTRSSARPAHPSPKPVPLMSQLLRRTTGTVADPFAGSGSTLVAAKQLGRHVIGVELEERYCEIAAIRLSQESLLSLVPADLPVADAGTSNEEERRDG